MNLFSMSLQSYFYVRITFIGHKSHLIFAFIGRGFPDISVGKESTCSGDLHWIPGLGRSAREGIGYPLQYSGLENSMDCIVCGVSKNQPWLSDFHFLSLFAGKTCLLVPKNSELSLQVCPRIGWSIFDQWYDRWNCILG